MTVYQWLMIGISFGSFVSWFTVAHLLFDKKEVTSLSCDWPGDYFFL